MPAFVTNEGAWNQCKLDASKAGMKKGTGGYWGWVNRCYHKRTGRTPKTGPLAKAAARKRRG